MYVTYLISVSYNISLEKQKSWIEKARQYLHASLRPVPHELNDLDWKTTLSEDNERTAQHICAFANQLGGGFFAFGVASTGEPQGVAAFDVPRIIQRLGNIARDALEPPQKVDHYTDQIEGKDVLLVYVCESVQKPVHLRGQSIEHSYVRSGGQTRKMSTQEIANAVLSSRHVRYEELEALVCEESEISQLLDSEKFLRLLQIPGCETREAILEQFVNQKAVYRRNGQFSITNIGAIAAAKDLTRFPGKETLPVRVIKYRGTSKIETEVEKEFLQGYGVGFQDLVRYIMSQLSTSEVIKDALRQNVPIYPEITIRELVANALIHRDFSMTGMNPMIEIFSDRMEISNPGALLPSLRIERLIDTAPESRNELFARLMRRMGICEERGSGIDKALFAIEVYGLPPVKFLNGPNSFKAIIYSPRTFKQMTQEERLNACLRHCCLRYYVADEPMTNASFRNRLRLKDHQYAITWRVISEAMERHLIKLRDPKSRYRKYAAYIPYWV